ncbi:unnamed protein product, partial [Rotaria sp. Silwood1]
SVIASLGWADSEALTQNPMSMLCNSFPLNAKMIPPVLNTMQELQQFPLSVHSIESNIQSVNSAETCTNFFNGLQTEFEKDIKNQGLKISDTKEPFKQFLRAIFPGIPLFN